jgi:hypothetical protein
MRLKLIPAAFSKSLNINSNKNLLTFTFLLSTFLIVLSLSSSTQAQLIEKWRVEVPSPHWAVIYGPAFGNDSFGNIYIMWISDSVDGVMNFCINKTQQQRKDLK